MRWTLATVLALGMMLIGASSFAGDDFTGPYAGVTAAYVAPIGDIDYKGLRSEMDAGLGLAFLGGYRFNKLLQLDGEFIWSKHDVLYDDRWNSFKADADTDMYQVLLELNFHFLYYCGVQVYAGPVFGYAFFDELNYDDDTRYEIEDSWIYGANLGIDVPFSKREDEKGWNFTARAKYLVLEPEVEATLCSFCGGIGDGSDPYDGGYGSTDVREFDLEINPWVFQAGILYKW